MIDNIIFEWDEKKRECNVLDHGIDFIETVTVFDDPKLSIILDVRKDYGEEIFNAYGKSNGRRMRVCFTMRGENIIRYQCSKFAQKNGIGIIQKHINKKYINGI